MGVLVISILLSPLEYRGNTEDKFMPPAAKEALALTTLDNVMPFHIKCNSSPFPPKMAKIKRTDSTKFVEGVAAGTLTPYTTD